MEAIRKIDVHAHATLWPQYRPKHPKNGATQLTPAQLFEEYYAALNVERCVLLPLPSPEANLTVTSNEEIKYMVDQDPDRLLWFAT